MAGGVEDHPGRLVRCNDDCWLSLETGVELGRCPYLGLSPSLLSGHVMHDA